MRGRVDIWAATSQVQRATAHEARTGADTAVFGGRALRLVDE